MILSLINSYNEAGRFLKRIFADAFGQGRGALLRAFRAHQHAQQVRVARPHHNARRAIAGSHLRAQMVRVRALAESAHLDRKERGRNGLGRPSAT